MVDENHPLVSIGVPVFNGEQGIARALDSLLGQNYPNLEIIISDNGSTDATQEICNEYVRKDLRVKYSRSEENLGALWNFKRVFELSSGIYFMWAAYDDRHEPFFVRTCVEKLEQCPDAVVCQGHVQVFVAGSGDLLSVLHLDSFEGKTELVERYQETLKNLPVTVIYGLFRSAAIRKTGMYQQAIAADLIFLQELSIYGNFVQVPKALFNYFIRENWNTIDQDYFAFFGKKKKPWWYLPFMAVFYNHWMRVARSSIPLGKKFRLWAVLIEYEIGQVALKFAIKITGLICPELWKEKLGVAIYSRFMHSSNYQIVCESLYLERVIKPVLGWWR